MKRLFIATFCFSIFGLVVQAQTGWNWDAQSYYGQAAPSPQESYASGGQVPVYTVDPSICFEPGWDLSGFVSYFSGANTEDAFGGGAALSYFFDRNIGIETNYAVHGQGEALHTFHTNAVYRLPINGCFSGAWAPYVFGGVGFLANGEVDFLVDFGAGVEVRFQSWGCVGLFADYSYNLVERDQDFSQFRGGFRMPF